VAHAAPRPTWYAWAFWPDTVGPEAGGAAWQLPQLAVPVDVQAGEIVPLFPGNSVPEPWQ
jgi:hypothetical protein